MALLPRSSYVSVTARRLKNARIVYANQQLINPDRVIEEYAFAVPTEIEPADAYGEEQKVFWADRYGGDGIGVNGGSGRSAQDDWFQLKGIGRTPLLGPDPSEDTFWHSHGGISLVEAIQETVWGEVFTRVLPHGASRVAAIIATGTECWYEINGSKSRAPRALVLRQITVRPAHYMRALYFAKAAEYPHVSDAERVRAAVQSLTTAFKQLGMARQGSEADLLGSGLMVMADRLGMQTAYAQVRRLMHGAISPSNVALDGRWVDFGTATHLPTFANTKSRGAPRLFATLWQEQDRVKAFIDPLCFYLNKYSNLTMDRARISPTLLAGHFDSCYASSRSQALVGMLGLPFNRLVRAANSSALRNFSAILAAMLREGHGIPVESRWDDTSGLGRNHLGPAICTLALSISTESNNNCLVGLVQEEQLRKEIWYRFRSFFELVAEEAGTMNIGKRPIATLLWIAGLKAGHSLTALFRKNMIDDNQRIVFESPDTLGCDEAVRCKVNSLGEAAGLLFAPLTDWDSVVFRGGGREVAYCARRAFWIERRSGEANGEFSRLSAPAVTELLTTQFGNNAQVPNFV